MRAHGAHVSKCHTVSTPTLPASPHVYTHHHHTFYRYLARLRAGEPVKWKPPRNADIEEIELKPPPIIPATNRFHERVELTPAEEDHTPYQLGAYDNLRAITHKRELAHLRKPVIEWTGEVRGGLWMRVIVGTVDTFTLTHSTTLTLHLFTTRGLHHIRSLHFGCLSSRRFSWVQTSMALLSGAVQWTARCVQVYLVLIWPAS